ncbi:MAG: hypothetical protein AB1898_22850 [Acidobacteriota bacterium]
MKLRRSYDAYHSEHGFDRVLENRWQRPFLHLWTPEGLRLSRLLGSMKALPGGRVDRDARVVTSGVPGLSEFGSPVRR